MFEFHFSKNNNTKDIQETLDKQYLGRNNLLPIMWGEHCIECSAPECYFTCKRYVSRADGHCARFENGIEPQIINGKVGGKVIFKPWAKIEATIEQKVMVGEDYLKVYHMVNAIGRAIVCVAKFMPGFSLRSKCQGAWEKIRKRLVGTGEKLDGIFELRYSILNSKAETAILVDLKGENGDLLMREKITIPIGRTSSSLLLERIHEANYINIHPADVDEKIELLFEELEVIKKSGPLVNTQITKKVKCVIWDLDNTLWDGVMIESEKVVPKPELVKLIKQLDSKGIVNSIASKNNEEQALDVLNRAGIADLFVFKRINWEPKSQNILKTIKGMNINANTFVFVDDNPFEREEVKSAIPDITCIDPSEIIAYAQTERFDVPLSEDSSKRRNTYKMLEQLNKEQEAWMGNIDGFLLSCQITLTISKPTENNVPRCFELLQRTNQLNSSGRRLTMEELTAILNSENYQCFVMESTDKFGNYGIIGFMIVEIRNMPCISDFVISCRVANKKIEPTLINYLAEKYGGEILFNFKKTKMNGPMKAVINELKMEKYSEKGDLETYQHYYNVNYPHIVKLTDNT